MNPTRYEFDAQLVMSNGVSASASIADILCANIPAASRAYKATQQEDRDGTDWWVEVANEHRLSIDCKVRQEDWQQKGRDDLALETWSVVEKRIAGWTRQPLKRTDYILWLWQDTGRWCLVPFPMLCRVFADRWQEWSERYGVRQQFTPRAAGGYHSECVFVPRIVVWREIYSRFGGAANEGHAA